ncbi:hypothetical protein ACQKMI_11415 [Lysinibacillus sp. NPDC097214]|uniref:hypothetical protein n=1 Tax=Lysinibacillus sp. NPDC097214 TaxID=3390584 RepID=UPI003D00E5DD
MKKVGLPPTRFTLHHLWHTVETLILQRNKENDDLRTLQEFFLYAVFSKIVSIQLTEQVR